MSVVERAGPRAWRGARAVVTAVLIWALLAVVVVGCGLTDRLLLWPQTGKLADTGGATRLALPSKDGELEVWRARSSVATERAPEAFVLRFYGNADRADRWVGSEARGLPFSAEIWGVNYPGFGGSSGKASLRGVAEAADLAYDALRARAGARPILVMGTSMGTTAALYLAARREVAGVVLQNPPALRQLIRGEHGWWNLWLLAVPIAWGVPEALDTLDNAAHARAPAIFVLSERDEVVPHRYHLAIRDAYAGPKQTFVIAGARHNDPVPEATARDVAQALAAIVQAAGP